MYARATLGQKQNALFQHRDFLLTSATREYPVT